MFTDPEKTDYKTAEEAMRNITQLMPHVVQGMLLLSKVTGNKIILLRVTAQYTVE